jgi:GTP1/Obg family GTP-binding protein
MDFNITPILDSDQLLDKAFGRASKKSARGKDKEEAARKRASMKLNSVSDTMEDTLKRYEKEFHP